MPAKAGIQAARRARPGLLAVDARHPAPGAFVRALEAAPGLVGGALAGARGIAILLHHFARIAIALGREADTAVAGRGHARIAGHRLVAAGDLVQAGWLVQLHAAARLVDALRAHAA